MRAATVILGVDATRASGVRTGVGRMLEWLIRSWAHQSLPFEQVRLFAPAPIPDLLQDDRFQHELVPGGGSGLWWEAAHLSPRARTTDVLFAVYTLPPLFRGRSVVYNLGIYEGRHAIPGWRARARSWHMSWSARTADHVFAMSRTVRDDLIRHYRLRPGAVDVAWPARDPRFRAPREGEHQKAIARIAELVGGEEPYFLFVGKPSERRNVPALLEAFRIAAPSGEHRLVLAGPNMTNLPLERLIGDLGLGRRVRHLVANQETLALLYRFARAFVMPSESDGFSLTIFEAMCSGTPVITLRAAPLGVLDRLQGPRSFDEGGPVLEAPDASPAQLARAIDRLIEDDELCAELGRRGRAYAETFPSWEETAGQIMATLAEVAGATDRSGRVPTEANRG